MKKFLIVILILIQAAFATAAITATADPRTMSFPPLHFSIPGTERVVLKNGMRVYLLEDHELPVVSITALVRTGSVYDPAGKSGLAALTGAVMRSGGTVGTPVEKIDDELEFMASSIETGIGGDAGTASMSCLARNLDRTLALFSQVLVSPAFRADRVELARKNTIEALRRENDNPKEVADRELNKLIYRGSPLGRYPTIASVSAITREDMVSFHDRYYHPDNVILSVAGDFSRKDILEKLERAFAGWKNAPESFPAVPVPEMDNRSGIYLVKKDVNQSVIRMGHLGVDKNNPDIYAIQVMNFILGGGGFESRLMSEVRTRNGLAYNVESGFFPGRRFPGVFTAETETRADSTARTIGLMSSIIEGMTKQPVTESELKQAKESIINSFIFAFTSSASVVDRKASLEYYGYPAGYLENYRANMAKVTRDDVLRVARKYLRPDALKLVVVGDENRFDKPLSTLGKVEEIKLNGDAPVQSPGASNADTSR